MRNRVFVLASIVVLSIGATIFAAGHGSAVMGHFQHRGDGPPPSFGPEMIDHMAGVLNLTDAQKSQLKTLLEAGQAAAEPIRQKMEDLHKQLESATVNGQFDEAQVRALATQLGQLTTETIVEHERIKAKCYSILTAEQRAKADEMHKLHGEHFRHSRPH
jgi:Spy/CpxP family protein refolding chaperone